MRTMVGLPNYDFSYGKKGLLVQKSVVYSASQRLILQSFGEKFQKLSNYPRLSGHPGGRKMYGKKSKGPCIDTTFQIICTISSPIAPHPTKKSRSLNFIVLVTDNYRKLTRAMKVSKIAAPVVAKLFLNDWIKLYGIYSSLLSNNGPQFFSKFSRSFFSSTGKKLKTTTAHHPQTKGQKYWYTKTIISKLRHYFNEHKSDWDISVKPFTYWYNSQV